MSLGLIIAGVVCLLLIVVVAIFSGKNKKAKHLKYISPLNALAEKVGGKISKTDIWNDSVIGIDEMKNLIFVIQKISTDEKKIVINLAEVFRCRVSEISRTSGAKEGYMKAFDRIDLVFSNREKSKADISVSFYNSETDRLTLTGELQLAEKWCTLVNNKLASIEK
jgi:predicted RND superfamily exporter protein